MRCPRCNTRMISSQHQEHEPLITLVRIKTVSIRECPSCEVIIQAIVPEFANMATSLGPP